MPSQQERFRIAVLDDYQSVALSLANWSVLDGRAMVTVFNDHLADPSSRSRAPSWRSMTEWRRLGAD